MAAARRPVLTAGCVLGLLLVSSLATGQPSDSKRRENLSTCLSGRYPSLCDHAMLAPGELKAALAAERRENLKTCLTGRYPSLCKHELLSTSETVQVREAERSENLKTCLKGRYPSLCKHDLLSASEAERVAAAEKSAGSVAQAPSARAAAPRASSTGRGRPRTSSSGCERDHWIDSVSDDGDIIKLEDGSIWEVDDVDTVTSALWLPITDVVVCEAKGKMINTDDNESVAVRRLK